MKSDAIPAGVPHLSHSPQNIAPQHHSPPCHSRSPPRHSREFREPPFQVTKHEPHHPVTTGLVPVVHGILRHRMDCPDKPGNDAGWDGP